MNIIGVPPIEFFKFLSSQLNSCHHDSRYAHILIALQVDGNVSECAWYKSKSMCFIGSYFECKWHQYFSIPLNFTRQNFWADIFCVFSSTKIKKKKMKKRWMFWFYQKNNRNIKVKDLAKWHLGPQFNLYHKRNRKISVK